MVHIIGASQDNTPRVFSRINKQQSILLAKKYESLIAASYNEDARQRRGLTGCIVDGNSYVTDNETSRRFDILKRWTEIMVGDLHWTWIKTVDHLPEALRTELDGKAYEPPGDDRAMWTPTTGESQ